MDAPRPLADEHDFSHFECGKADLDGWLHRHARRSEGRTARTYVVAEGGRVLGYYCLAAGAVARDSLPTNRLRANAPEQVPVVIVGRLAVDRREQGRGIGEGILKDALIRAVETSRTIGVRAILVHAIDDEAAAFYRRYGFVESHVAPGTLVLPIETVIAALP